MSYIEKITFKLNTVITALPRNEKGQFDQAGHRQAVRQLEELVEAIDGVSRCEVTVSGIDVHYHTNVVEDVMALVHAVTSLVAVAANEEGTKLFPRRGDKIPTATVVDNNGDRAAVVVRVAFGQYITRFYPLLGQVGLDGEKFLLKVRDVINTMTSIHGVTGYDFGLDAASITIDTRYCSPEAATKHLLTVFDQAAAATKEGEGYCFFPFRGSEPPVFKVITELV